MPISDVAIRNAKPSTGIVKMSDGGGLQLWIMPNGSKLWRVAYRFSGKQKRLQKLLTLGAYPAVSLSSARQGRDDAKALLAKGIDPAEQRRRDEEARADSNANTFAKLAAEVLEKKRKEGKASGTLAKREWFNRLADADLGHRAIRDITASDVLAVLRKAEGRGLIETAHKLRASIGEVFRYAIATQRADNDPTYALRGALQTPVTKHRAAILDPQELGGLLRAIDGFKGQPTTTAALKLMALLFPRPGELRWAEWQEFDLDKAVWIIPASRTKMRREHRVPLPRQAIAILKGLQAYTGHCALVFPGLGSLKRPISENTLNGALRRMGYAQDEMTSHGFRAAASTLLNEAGLFSADAIERALAHQDADAVRRAYARGAHWQERVALAQWWADNLDTLRDGAKVIPFAKESAA
jgi:integrase